jgi:PAS domain S-box-containing protein
MKAVDYFGNKKNAVITFIFSAVVCIIFASLYYFHIKKNFINQAKSELRAVAELKISEIVKSNYDELNDAKLISSDYTILKYLDKIISEKAFNRSELKHIFSELKLEHGYKNILFVDNKYQIRFDSNNEKFEIPDLLLKVIKENKGNAEAFTTDIFYCPVHKEIHIEYISQVKFNNESLGYLVFILDPGDLLFALTKNYPGEKKTTETVIVKKEGDYVMPISPLKFRENPELKIKTPLSKKNYPSVEALKGEKKFFDGVDYRNEKIISFISPIEGTNWFFVSKVDEAEIYKEINKQVFALIIFMLLFLIASFFLIFWLYHYQQRNLYRELFNEQKTITENESEFKTILYSIGDALIITDKFGMINNINPVAENLTGWKETEAKGKSIEEVIRIINEQTRNKVENPVEKVLREGTVVGLANHTLLISKDGKEIPIADSGAPIKNDEGEILGVVLVFRDQTKEREAIAKIEKSEFRLNRAEIASKSGNWELHLDTKKIIGSKGACLIYGVNASEFDYETIKKIPLHEYRPKLDEALKNLIERNIPYEVEFKIRALDSGEIKDIHSIAFYDSERKIIFGIIQDVTQRKEIEKKLAESEANLLSLINNKDQAIWSLDENYNLIICNDYFKNSYKAAYNYELKVGINLVEILPPKLKAFWKPKYDKALSGEKVDFEFSETILGKKYYFQVFLNPIFIDGKIKGVSALSVDITELKEAEEKLESSEINYRTIFNSTSEAVFIDDASTGQMIDINDTVLKMYGYDSKEEVLALNIGELSANIGEYSNERAQELIRKTIEEGPQRFEWLAKRKDGSTFWIEMYLKKTYILGQERILAVGREIDEQKKAKEKILNQLAELQRWQNVMLNREDRVIELKKEVNELLQQLGKQKKYEIT